MAVKRIAIIHFSPKIGRPYGNNILAPEIVPVTSFSGNLVQILEGTFLEYVVGDEIDFAKKSYLTAIHRPGCYAGLSYNGNWPDYLRLATSKGTLQLLSIPDTMTPNQAKHLEREVISSQLAVYLSLRKAEDVVLSYVKILGELAYGSVIALATGHSETTVSRILNRLEKEGKVIKTKQTLKFGKSPWQLQDGVLANHSIDERELSLLVH